MLFFWVFSLHISSQEARPLPTAVRNTTSLTEGRPVIGVGRLLAAQEVPRWGYEQEQGEYYQSKHLQPAHSRLTHTDSCPFFFLCSLLFHPVINMLSFPSVVTRSHFLLSICSPPQSVRAKSSRQGEPFNLINEDPSLFCFHFYLIRREAFCISSFIYV